MNNNDIWHQNKPSSTFSHSSLTHNFPSLRGQRPRSPNLLEAENQGGNDHPQHQNYSYPSTSGPAAASAYSQQTPPPPALRSARRKREREDDMTKSPKNVRKKTHLPQGTNAIQSNLIRIASETQISTLGNALILSPKPQPSQSLHHYQSTLRNPQHSSNTHTSNLNTPIETFTDSDSDPDRDPNQYVIQSWVNGTANSSNRPPLTKSKSRIIGGWAPPRISRKQTIQYPQAVNSNSNKNPNLTKNASNMYFHGKKRTIGRIQNSFASFGETQFKQQY